MNNKYVIGNVISIDGTKITILMNEHSNLESFYYDGMIYSGVSIGNYLGIIKGAYKIVARVEKQFLEDTKKEPLNQEFLKDRFEKRLLVSVIGNFYKREFKFGIKKFPMIFNEVVLLTEEEIKEILHKDSINSKHKIPIGKSLSNEIPIELRWDNLFNTHLGIFGNTGSGKSNTLTKIYSELLDCQNKKEIKPNFKNKSKFFIIDFNGEYIEPNVIYNSNNKKCLNLCNQGNKKSNDQLFLSSEVFWSIETLAILYSATEKTQRPFLKNAVKKFLNQDEKTPNDDITSNKIIENLSLNFRDVFSSKGNKHMLRYFRECLKCINFEKCIPNNNANASKANYQNIKAIIENAQYNSKYKIIFTKYFNSNNKIYVDNSDFTEKLNNFQDDFKKILSSEYIKKQINNLKLTQKIKITVYSHLVDVLSHGEYEIQHIQPLIARMEEKSDFIEKTIKLVKKEEYSKTWKLLNVISLKNCNTQTKKMLALLLTKQLYHDHKQKSKEDQITSTIHLVIDEAHNVLSEQSVREDALWKDYRLEVFEEIIKEGRKFGFFMTIATQRPNDISPTIISQLHNYFIHRLVNEQDLRMIANTINSLDYLSKSQIPTLAPGQCIITGTSFEMPLVIQVDKLSKEKSPNSENADLVRLWTNENK